MLDNKKLIKIAVQLLKEIHEKVSKKIPLTEEEKTFLRDIRLDKQNG